MPSILYCGDTSLLSAAGYLAGLMTKAGWPFDYLASDQPPGDSLETPRSLIILSDYPAAQMPDAVQQQLLKQVANGAGLLMCGGWESFHGHGGNWDSRPLTEALPVQMFDFDDRCNCDHPVVLEAEEAQLDHPILQGLPWDERPPLIGGYNRVQVKPEAELLLAARHYYFTRSEGRLLLKRRQSSPLLVVGAYGDGRTAALMTDPAPHWVGPLIDWGDQRVRAQAEGAEVVEVGDLYAQFLQQLLAWTGRIN
ncbi:glutamine amidotransferase [Lignipirellula cremea]|uniref:Putative glutamine amidotransferase domain-containing protein n=1 Tax=Lignipirellula cremea TaxID=2528010 RepID=A0A518DSE8_9BACT|nr:glutamine amidotransferase [Lignipirellula cremea]QDU94772.1 hypothetical protein Pla8534_25790 [Lignipirellula cremea]